MSSSGIGRGRGWLNINKNQNIKPGISNSATIPPSYDHNTTATTSGPKVNPKYTNIIAKVGLFDENDDGILLNQKLKHVIEELNTTCQTANDVQEIFEIIHETSLHDNEFANKAVGMVSTPSFNSVVIHGVKLRNIVICQYQKDFDNCKQLQSTNPEAFRNTVKMLGDYFHKARLADGRQITFLARPILTYMEMLLESNNDQDIELFTVQVFMNGNAIKEQLPTEIAKALIQVRTLLANNDKLSVTSKMWLMMALDISYNRYGLLPNDLHQFYVEQLGDEAMSHIKKLNTELSIQTSYQNMKLENIQSNVNVLQQVDNSQTSWSSGKTTSTTEEKKTETQQKFNLTHNYGNADTSFNNIGTWDHPKQQEKTPRPILGVGARLKQNNDSWKDRKSDNDWDDSSSGGWDNKKKGSGNWNNSNNKQKKTVPKGWEHDDRLENDYN